MTSYQLTQKENSAVFKNHSAYERRVLRELGYCNRGRNNVIYSRLLLELRKTYYNTASFAEQVSECKGNITKLMQLWVERTTH